MGGIVTPRRTGTDRAETPASSAWATPIHEARHASGGSGGSHGYFAHQVMARFTRCTAWGSSGVQTPTVYPVMR